MGKQIERVLSVERVEDLIAVFGSFDENTKRIEEALNVKIVNRGTDLKVSGDEEDVDKAIRTLEGLLALSELRSNAHAFAQLSTLVQRHWGKHNTLVGFAMDHGCHEIDGNNGSHGLDMDEDLNIVHVYKGYPRA